MTERDGHGSGIVSEKGQTQRTDAGRPGQRPAVDHNALLGLAERYVAEGGPREIQLACWLGRQALQMLIDEFLRHVAPDARAGSARSRLAVLTVAFSGTTLPRATRAAWENLSEASHLHAYQLSPTPSEVRGWLADVRGLSDQHRLITNPG